MRGGKHEQMHFGQITQLVPLSQCTSAHVCASEHANFYTLLDKIYLRNTRDYVYRVKKSLIYTKMANQNLLF